jgi:hypothetical protein
VSTQGALARYPPHADSVAVLDQKQSLRRRCWTLPLWPSATLSRFRTPAHALARPVSSAGEVLEELVARLAAAGGMQPAPVGTGRAGGQAAAEIGHGRAGEGAGLFEAEVVDLQPVT